MARQQKNTSPQDDPAKLIKAGAYVRRDYWAAFKTFQNTRVSDGIQGAILLWMALDQQPDLREAATRLANLPVNEAVEKCRPLIRQSAEQLRIQDHIRSLSAKQKRDLLDAEEEG